MIAPALHIVCIKGLPLSLGCPIGPFRGNHGPQFAIIELSQLVKELNGGNFDFLGVAGLFPKVLILILSDVMDELPEQVLHQV